MPHFAYMHVGCQFRLNRATPIFINSRILAFDLAGIQKVENFFTFVSESKAKKVLSSTM